MLFAALATVVVQASARAADQPLVNLIEHLQRPTKNEAAPIVVTAVAAVEKNDFVLKFALTNMSRAALSFYKSDLPWSNTYSIRWAAIAGDGRVIPMRYPIDDDFGTEQISVAPGQTLKGTYSLTRMLDRKLVPANTELAIIWAYTFPTGPVAGKNIPRAEYRSTGVATLRTPK